MKKITLYILLIAIVACTHSTDLTFSKDIAPIIYENCTPCHRSGGAAPFSLTNYQQVNRKRNTILDVTQSGYMPPWPADRNYTHFIGERYLSESQKDILKDWITGGAPEGNPLDLPALPEFPEYSNIGTPDTTVWFDSIYISGNSRDKFFIATLPIHLPSDKYVRAYRLTHALCLNMYWRKQYLFRCKTMQCYWFL